ncbi:hypothetical protein CHUAL_011795 [Chamberlinius hualienensis]
MDLSLPTVERTEKVSMRSTEYRKVIKPLLERRRRARINNCLDELKALILETTDTENADASKLEKADILELTVQHLRNHHRQQQKALVSGEDKFRAGFAECAHQISSFLSNEDHIVKSRLMSHLAGCMDRIPHVVVRQPSSPTPPPSPISPVSTICPTPTATEFHEYKPTSIVDTPNHLVHPRTPTEYVSCSSPESFGHYRMDIRPTIEELSDVYYSSAPTVYMRKIKRENGNSRPWRPW